MRINICASMQKHHMWMFLRALMKVVKFHAEDFPQYDGAVVAGVNAGRNNTPRFTFLIFSLWSCTDFRAPYCHFPNDSFPPVHAALTARKRLAGERWDGGQIKKISNRKICTG